MHFAICTNTFSNLQKYLVQGYGVAVDEIWKVMWLNKDIFEFGQIYLSIWTNTFENLDKYILQQLQTPSQLVRVEGVGVKREKEEAQPIKSQLWWLCKVAEKKGKRSGRGSRYNHNWVSEKKLPLKKRLKKCSF